MIRLVALDQANSAQTTLDLEGAPSISLNLAVAKPGETMQRHAPYSQTFRLPFTNTNNQFFAHFYEVTLADGDFDPTQKTEVIIYESGVPVMRGAMQLRAVRLMAKVYEVNVLGDVADLFAEMGSKLLEAAFQDGNNYVTTYNYDNTAANVISSQTLTNDITSGLVGDGTIVIPLADHGLSVNQQPIVAQSGYGFQSSTTSNAGVFPDMLKPAIKLKALTDRIIEQAGFYYDSDFFDSTLYGGIYMTLGTEVEQLTTGEANRCRVGVTSDQSVTTQAQWTAITMDDESSDGTYDPDNAFNTTTYKYTAQESGVHRFALSLSVKAIFANQVIGDTMQVIARISDDNEISQGSASVEMVCGSSNVFIYDDRRQITFASDVVLTAGDTIKGEIRFQEATSGNSIQVEGISALFLVPTSVFICDRAPGGEVNVPKLLPRIKQKELMADLCQRFNLVIEASPDDPKKLIIEPYADWITDGVDTYWTDKLDLDKERTLMPTSSLKADRILFQDKESPDVGNAYMTNALGRVYGGYDQDIDDEFASGTLGNAPVFAPYFVYPVPTLQGDPHTVNEFFLIHRSYQLNGQGVKFVKQPPKLFFAVGSQDIQDNYYLGTTAFSSYLFCSPFNESPVDSDTQSLVWNSQDVPFSPNNELLNEDGTPAVGLHRTYWAPYLADIYDADARVFEAHFYLTPSDIRNLRFNNRYHVLGAAYKLTEVSGYQIGTGESTLCKFLRDIDRATVGACQNVPSTSNANGTVTFTDPSGADVTDPGRICCEAYGYYYDATTNTCRWQNPGDDTNDPAPPYPPTDGTNPLPNNNGDTPGPIAPTGMHTTSQDSAGHSGVTDFFVLMGETTDASATALSTPNGVNILVDGNTLATGTIDVSSVTAQTSGRFTSRLDTYQFLANGHAGTVSLSATNWTPLTSGSPATRRITGALSNGVLTISANGQASTVIQWTAQVQMVRIFTYD